MHCSWRRLLRRGLEFHLCTINKSTHTKKSENSKKKKNRFDRMTQRRIELTTNSFTSRTGLPLVRIILNDIVSTTLFVWNNSADIQTQLSKERKNNSFSPLFCLVAYLMSLMCSSLNRAIVASCSSGEGKVRKGIWRKQRKYQMTGFVQRSYWPSRTLCSLLTRFNAGSSMNTSAFLTTWLFLAFFFLLRWVPCHRVSELVKHIVSEFDSYRVLPISSYVLN